MIGWSIFVIASFLDQTRCLERLPAVEENDIVKTEAVIRNTTNQLFATFNLKGVQNQPTIKQYSSIHKYFVSLTLQDYDSLNQIAEHTRVDKNKMETVIANFIALLNEILDEENIVTLAHVLNGEVEGSFDVVDELNKIEHMKNLYLDSSTVFDVNGQILKIFKEDKRPNCGNMTFSNNHTVFDKSNETESELHLHNDTILNKDGYWRPKDAAVPTRRIFGGLVTKINHYAFMASVEFFGKFQCGSSIIKTDLIITAASCLQLAWNNRFFRENPAFLSVRVGSSFYESEGEKVPIIEIYFYPSYNPRKLTNNLAIMRMIRHVYWKRKVKRIEIDTIKQPLPLNVDGVVIVGWGALTMSDKLISAYQNKIQFSVLDVYPLDECRETYSSDFVTEKNFCAGFVSQGHGACNRDIGGPGIVAGFLTGVISFGAPVCGTPDAPTVFTKVGYYSDWIETIMQMEAPQSKKRTTTTENPREFFYALPPLNRTKHPQYINLLMTVAEKHLKHSTISHDSDSDTMEPFEFPDLAALDQFNKDAKMQIVRNQEKKLFKQFLKTMFNSDEVQEYIETQKQTNQPEVTANTVDIDVPTQPTTEANVNQHETNLYLNFDNIENLKSVEVQRDLNKNEDRENAVDDGTNTNLPEKNYDEGATWVESETTTEAVPIDNKDWNLRIDQEPEIPDVEDIASKENQIDLDTPGSDVELEQRIMNLINTFTVLPEQSEKSLQEKTKNTELRSKLLRESATSKKEVINEVMKEELDGVVQSLLEASTKATRADYDNISEEANEIQQPQKNYNDLNPEIGQNKLNDAENLDNSPPEEPEPAGVELTEVEEPTERVEQFQDDVDAKANKKSPRNLLVDVLREMLGAPE